MNDDDARWEALLRVDLMAAAFGLAALWIHAKWRKRVAVDQWRGRRWAAGISLIAFEASLLAFVALPILFWWASVSNLDNVHFDPLGRLFRRSVGAVATLTCISSTVLIGVMGAPIAADQSGI